MHIFSNILYVSFAIENETEGLKQALSLASSNQASLKILLIYPEFPDNLLDYKKKYEHNFVEQIKSTIQTILSELKLSATDLSIDIQVESNNRPAICIIHHVLNNGHDLVIKEATSRDSGEGFKAIDMNLLSKSPCPVWLCRPIKHSQMNIRVAVAIDPESEELVAHSLSLKMLQLSRALADTCDGKLEIISCWDVEYEKTLRDNVFIQVSQHELLTLVTNTEIEHRAGLERLIKESKISGKFSTHHLKGQPEQMIPSFVKAKGIDILVMGTVARTGIRGFIFGNTAENVIQQLNCSLLALKPNGFVSPVSLPD